MALPGIHKSPLGTSEDSLIIKGELHRCNISKSSLAKQKRRKKKEKDREWKRGMRALRRRKEGTSSRAASRVRW